MSADDADRPTDEPELDPAELMKLALDQESLYHSDGSPLQAIDPERLATLLPEFEILELVGQGGMGAVFRARQRKLDREVAIKVLPPEIAKDPAFAERFQREARTLAKLSHPHIVTIHDFGEAEGLYYLVMEYVPGLDLKKLMDMGRLSPEEALRIVPQICDALQFAHEHGIVHRDIKPGNVLIDQQGFVRVADFGLARILGQDPDAYTLTLSQQRLGTPHYMAPEQIEEPSRVDHRADLFSLGVVLYEMLTGRLPLGRFDPPSSQSDVGEKVDEAVLKSLEAEPERRYQAAHAMKQEVEAAWKEGFTAGAQHAAPASPEASSPAPSPLRELEREIRASSGGARLSLSALGGFLWLFFGGAMSWLMLAGGSQSPYEGGPGDPAFEDATEPQVNLVLTIIGILGAAGLLGGPILGFLSIHWIRQSAGALYGLGLAIFTACCVPLVVANVLIGSLVMAVLGPHMAPNVARPVQLLTFLALFIIDIVILVKIHRRLSRGDSLAAVPVSRSASILGILVAIALFILLLAVAASYIFGDSGS